MTRECFTIIFEKVAKKRMSRELLRPLGSIAHYYIAGRGPKCGNYGVIRNVEMLWQNFELHGRRRYLNQIVKWSVNS